ncbi:MAG: AAA family ATPase, partial [Candidatus Obscuribacterales bacterium]|nr:AAA family ATPase [Candidatus Obscuribacterales bacterium]
MKISKIMIQNFRNFRKLEVELDNHGIIIGENKVGKTNLLHALRLVLDPSLSDTARMLKDEDFWDGLSRPLDQHHEVHIFVELSDFHGNKNLKAQLHEHLVASGTARLNYVFRPKSTFNSDNSFASNYEYLLFGGDDDSNTYGGELVRMLPVQLLQALRDAETDLSSWRKSPL